MLQLCYARINNYTIETEIYIILLIKIILQLKLSYT